MAPNRSISPLSRTKVFISYSHADKEWLKRLKRHLKPLIRDGYLDCWDDTHIQPGDDWKQEIRTALDAAQVAVLLISADFFASDFIDEAELLPLLAGAQEKGVRILPVILSASRFARHPDLARFQAVNPPDQPLDMMPKGKQEEILERLARTIESSLDPPSPTPDRRLDVPDTQSRKHFTRWHPWKLALIAAPLAIIIAIYVLIAFDRDLLLRSYLLRLHLPPKLTSILVQILPNPPEPRLVQDCENCPKMMVVPAGTFMMGSPDSEPDRSEDEGPQEYVTIDHDFRIGQHEVTIGEWRNCDFDKCQIALQRVKKDQDQFQVDNDQLIDRYPMTVTWDEAKDYLDWLNKKTNNKYNYRLPSEAEWEYAARAGSTSARYWGDGVGVGNANCINCGTTSVGSFKHKNGFYDMSGNVWEWVESECLPFEEYCLEKLYGGSWDNLRPTIMSSMSRPLRAPKWQRAPTFGFRVAVDLEKGDLTNGDFREQNDNDFPLIKRVIDQFGKQFGLGVYEVRVKEWNRCVHSQEHEAGDKVNKCTAKVDQDEHPEHPVTGISYDEAEVYLTWLSMLSHRTYRLPTEDEWKNAAGTGTDTPRSDDSIVTGYANCIDCGSHRSAEVSSYGKNPYGLFDILGNVWEWTLDCYHPNYTGAPPEVLKEGRPWEGKPCEQKVARGGSWDNLPHRVRSAARHSFGPDKSEPPTIGFRIARDVTSADDR